MGSGGRGGVATLGDQTTNHVRSLSWDDRGTVGRAGI